MPGEVPARTIYTPQERADAIENALVVHFVTVTRMQRDLCHAVIEGRRAADAMERLERRLAGR